MNGSRERRSCCTSGTDSEPCPRCGDIGPIVGVAPVRPHRTEAEDGPWQHCANPRCAVVFHLDKATIVAAEMIAQVGAKATVKATPVCFCFAHTAESLAADLEANDGQSTIKRSVKTAVTEGLCACEHLNPSGLCCLSEIHRTLKEIKIGDVAVSGKKLFKSANPFQNDVLALPVADIDEAASYYSMLFGMSEVSRSDSPNPRVVLERDGVQLGFEVNGGDSSQDGAAILVTDAARARQELEANGVITANWRIDERDGETFQVFFVVAPDGLCYYFHQLISS